MAESALPRTRFVTIAEWAGIPYMAAVGVAVSAYPEGASRLIAWFLAWVLFARGVDLIAEVTVKPARYGPSWRGAELTAAGIALGRVGVPAGVWTGLVILGLVIQALAARRPESGPRYQPRAELAP